MGIPTRDLVAITEICALHGMEVSFLKELNDIGLIEITSIQQMEYVAEERLPELERLFRLKSDLQINIEGIHAVDLLLKRIKSYEDEMITMKNKLSFYESVAQ